MNASQAAYNLTWAAALGSFLADAHAMRAQDEREAAHTRQRAAEAGEKARRMRAQGAEQRRTILARLKAAMVAAHPDKGGTAAEFIRARRIYVAARRGYRPA